mgnify:FL=1
MERIIVKGAPGSPYTRKMLSLLRYRRLPYNFLVGGLFDKGIMDTSHLPKAKVNLMPTIYFKNKLDNLEPMVDSTFIIRRLENLFKERSVVPNSPILKFLDYLLEDFADEWLTKATFHYRWTYDQDIKKAGSTLSRWRSLTDNEEKNKAIKSMISERQISRLYVVGSNKTTLEIIEGSYKRILKLMDNNMNNSPYLLGNRPSSSDFAFYGQLTQLASFDPTPMKLADDIAPRVVAWVGVMEDLSGLEVTDKDWVDENNLSESFRNIFYEIGNTYIPVLKANYDAVYNNEKEVNIEIQDTVWKQKPFPYQAKCLNWLKDEYKNLASKNKKFIDNFLCETGCELLFNGK